MAHPSRSPRSSSPRAGNAMRWDAKTLMALGPIVAILVGGAEARLAVSRLEDKVDRLADRIVQLERTGHFARNDDQ